MKEIKLTLFCLALVSFVAACSTVPVTGRKQIKFVPDAQMLSMSFNSYNQFLQSNANNVDQTSEEAKMVKRVGERIRTGVETYLESKGLGKRTEDFEWEFNLVRDQTVNAWCMPGGKVVFYSGILPICQDETGIAVVMGHEVAHAIAEHGNERMSQTLMAQGLLLAGSIAVDTNPRLINQLLLQAAGVGTQLGLLSFSRKHEAEADEMGIMFMAIAGYNPTEAPRFWGRMQAAAGGAQPPEFLSTHPSHDTRIEKLNENMTKAMEYYQKFKDKY